MQDDDINKIISVALQEDFGDSGDVTTHFLIDPNQRCRAAIYAKQDGVICGGSVAKAVFQAVDASLAVELNVEDGGFVEAGFEIAALQGSAHSILAAERTALNFLQRLSGIATKTRQFVVATKGTRTRILDTRKTTPGLRSLEKYAVKIGGGENHRFGLYDMVLLKENHIKAAGGLTRAIEKVHERMVNSHRTLKVEAEVRNMEEVREAITLQIDRLMLDNMDIKTMKKAVDLVGGRMETEASGGVTLDLIPKIARTGVDYISVGALTHSVQALDLSLLML